jgi:predicted RNA-binding protein YlqC (UPF0109 family)
VSDYEAGDINTISDDDVAVDENLGNEVASSMPEAVLTYLAKQLTREPDAVVVEAEGHGNEVKLRLHVGPDDMGRVIGRRGRTAQAIRALVAVAGARTETRTNVDIVDD